MSTQEVRTLELRVGQVVRGVVTQQLPNQEALVNINGVQIKAKLEIPIMEGQATLMQVAADSKGSFIHLKQVDASAMGLQDPMKDIIKAMNLPDKEWSNQLIRELRQEGFPLNKDTIQAFAQAARLAPANVDMESWMQAASMAFKRGMPMTLASISGMQQLSQGQPLHQLLTQLQQQLSQLLQTQGQQLSGQSTQILQQLSNHLNQMLQAQTLSQANGAQVTLLGQQESSTTQANLNILQTQTQNGGQQQLTNQAATQANLQGNQVNVTQQANVIQNPIASFMKLLGVNHENQLGQQLLQRGEGTANQSQVNQANASQQAQQNPPSTFANNMQTQSGITQAPATANQALQTQQGLSNPANQGQVTQSIQQPPAQQAGATQQTGVSQQVQNSQQILSNHNQVNQEQLSTSSTTLTNQQPANGILADGQQIVQAEKQLVSQQLLARQTIDLNNGHSQSQVLGTTQASESMKATVLQALQLTDVPASIKEPLNQLLNHITGQQMMLSTERNQSMFTHITMYVPIKDDQGGQTAAIHVQTRRDRKGQLDAENCRIVFDLNMKQLGQTLVDLNVVNKIVSINIWNDASYIEPLVNSMRPEMIEAMQKTGYSLSSIKTTPFKQEEQQNLEEVKAIVQPPDVQHMSASRYKGVDLKI